MVFFNRPAGIELYILRVIIHLHLHPTYICACKQRRLCKYEHVNKCALVTYATYVQWPPSNAKADSGYSSTPILICCAHEQGSLRQACLFTRQCDVYQNRTCLRLLYNFEALVKKCRPKRTAVCSGSTLLVYCNQ